MANVSKKQPMMIKMIANFQGNGGENEKHLCIRFRLIIQVFHRPICTSPPTFDTIHSGKNNTEKTIKSTMVKKIIEILV